MAQGLAGPNKSSQWNNLIEHNKRKNSNMQDAD